MEESSSYLCYQTLFLLPIYRQVLTTKNSKQPKRHIYFSGKHYVFICYQLADFPQHRAGSRSKANVIFLAPHFLSSPFPKTLKLPFTMGTEGNMSDKQNIGVFHYVVGEHLFNVHSQIHQHNVHTGTHTQPCRKEEGIQPSSAYMTISLNNWKKKKKSFLFLLNKPLYFQRSCLFLPC